MSEHMDSVKQVALYLRDLHDKNVSKPELAKRLDGYSTALFAAAEHMLALEGLTSALPPDLGNIHDLPKELLDELSVAKTDELEDQLVTVINAYGGEASLDQILVGLYRKFQAVQKRRFIQNKLYRMDMIWSVDGKKGVYTTVEPTEQPQTAQEDWEDLIGDVAPKRQEVDEEAPF